MKFIQGFKRSLAPENQRDVDEHEFLLGSLLDIDIDPVKTG